MPIAIPTDRQIAMPFQFGDTGGVADTTDLTKQTQDHVFSLIGTQQTERVMESAYGTNVMPYLFEPLTDMTLSDIQQSIAAAVLLSAPEVTLNSIDVSTDESNGISTLHVNYELAAAQGSVETLSIPVALITG